MSSATSCLHTPLRCCRALMHSVPCNGKAKCFPLPTPALLSLELPKRKVHEQPYAEVPSASAGPAPTQGRPTAVFEAYHPLPSSRGGPGPAKSCPRAHTDPLPAGWPCATQARAETRTHRGEVAGSQGTCPPLLRGKSSAALQLHQRTTRKFGRSGFSLRVLWSRRRDGFGVKPQVQGSMEI